MEGGCRLSCVSGRLSPWRVRPPRCGHGGKCRLSLGWRCGRLGPSAVAGAGGCGRLAAKWRGPPASAKWSAAACCGHGRACAPRYVWFTENLKRREPVGTCYVARQGLTDFQEFSPCRTREYMFLLSSI
ncbi:integrin alpha-5-like [Homarus americanus]|uniref:integrin alpha-5-like n=1 Tax=Homarus americanus TaxID=6706 RepID=UPI001C49750F|nr:integrin alpha-5-like [Homarus americanus]